MNRKKVLILIVSVLCVVIAVAGLLSWCFEVWAEQRLQFYIEKLERHGYTVEEQPISSFKIDELEKAAFYNDFTMEAVCEGVKHVYFDRKAHILYFLYPEGNKACIFYYTNPFDEI